MNTAVLNFIREWRVVALLIMAFVASFANRVFEWYISLENPTDGQSALATAVILAIVPALFSWTGSSATKVEK